MSKIHFDRKEKRTKDSFGDETNINNIMRKYQGRRLANQPLSSEFFRDLSGVQDLQTAMNNLIDIQHEFMRIPPQIRLECQNNVVNLPAFILNPKNREVCKKMGWITEENNGNAAGPQDPEGEGVKATATNAKSVPKKKIKTKQEELPLEDPEEQG